MRAVDGDGKGDAMNRVDEIRELVSRHTRMVADKATCNPLVILEDFRLAGDLASQKASFTLTATARVADAKGGSLELLSGILALTDIGSHPHWQLRADQNRQAFFVTGVKQRSYFLYPRAVRHPYLPDTRGGVKKLPRPSFPIT